MLAVGKYILRYFYKISSIQIYLKGLDIKKINQLFYFGDSNGDPDRKNDIIWQNKWISAYYIYFNANPHVHESLSKKPEIHYCKNYTRSFKG